jgi:hypothetical protein
LRDSVIGVICVLAVSAAAAVGLCTSTGAGDPAPVGIAHVAWLGGCWERSTARGSVEEQWMAPRGGCMIGISRSVRADTLFAHEFLLIREQEGRLAYEARPSGQAPATFVASSASDSMVVFANPEHDFPQRIGYRRAGPDSLVAWIEGTIDGAVRRVDFSMRRTTCPGAE